MGDSIIYHDGNRRLRDCFASRRISDRLEEKLTRTGFTPEDKDISRACHIVSWQWRMLMADQTAPLRVTRRDLCA